MKKAILIIVPFILMMIILFISGLQYLEISKSMQRVYFAKLLENEKEISDKLALTIYKGLQADYCGFLEDQNSITASFIWSDEIQDVVNEIDMIFSKQREGIDRHCE